MKEFLTIYVHEDRERKHACRLNKAATASCLYEWSVPCTVSFIGGREEASCESQSSKIFILFNERNRYLSVLCRNKTCFICSNLQETVFCAHVRLSPCPVKLSMEQAGTYRKNDAASIRLRNGRHDDVRHHRRITWEGHGHRFTGKPI